MRKNHLTYKASSDPLWYSVTRSGNTLDIVSTRYLWDNYQNKLMLVVESDHMFSQESTVSLKDKTLTFESPVLSTMDKPFRTHLIDRDIREEFENGVLEIGVAKISLKSGYDYTLQSFQLINSSLIRVNLSYRIAGKQYHN